MPGVIVACFLHPQTLLTPFPLAKLMSLLLTASKLIRRKKVKWTLPINVLPVELLARIFCWLRHLDDEKTGVTLHARTPPWIPILHVCSSWRSIALGCKELWAIIPLGHPEWTKMALSLSQPLDIALRVPGTRLFTPNRRLTAVDDRLSADALVLALIHVSRISSLELNMHPRESTSTWDLRGQQAYVRARTFLTPLRDGNMHELHSLVLRYADLTSGSLPGDHWTQNIHQLSLIGCRFSSNLNLLALPLVTLKIVLSDFRGSFAELLVVLDSCKSLRSLLILESLSSRLYDELFDEGFLRRTHRHVSLPDLQSLTLFTSPLLASVYISLFDIPSSTAVTVSWWASSYRVSSVAHSKPLVELEELDLKLKPASDVRVLWLSQLCVAFARYVYLSIAADSSYKNFQPSFLSSHPIVQELDSRTGVMPNALCWCPGESAISMSGGIGTQPTVYTVFGVTAAIRKVSEWTPIFEAMRRYGGRGYTTPAAFTCTATTEAERRDKPCLTLIALDHVNLTVPYMRAYFPVVKHVLRHSFPASNTLFNVDVLFPFGLKLDAKQKAEMRAFNVRICDYDTNYTFAEFY